MAKPPKSPILPPSPFPQGSTSGQPVFPPPKGQEITTTPFPGVIRERTVPKDQHK